VFLAANAALSAVLIPFGVERLGGSRQTGLLLSALGAGFLLGAPPIRVLVDRYQPRHLLAATLAATAAAFFLLFSSSSLAAALPAAAAAGMFGSMSLVVPRTVLPRVVPNAALGRVSAVFAAGGAAATLTGPWPDPPSRRRYSFPGWRRSAARRHSRRPCSPTCWCRACRSSFPDHRWPLGA